MRLSWKLLVPLALINLAVVAFWLKTTDWTGALWHARWILALAANIIPFILIARHMSKNLAPRKYRYAP